MSKYVSGRNPVIELLKAGEKTVNKILLSHKAHGSAIEEILNLAKERKIPVHNVPPVKLDKISNANNQGVVAEVTEGAYFGFEELLEKLKSSFRPLIIVLDGIEDPHNLGAIIRNAVAFGADGIIIGKWRSAGLTETVARSSAGAIEHIPVVRVTNIAECINTLKDRNYWVIGAEAGGKPVENEKFNFPLALVIGSEGNGISRLVKERCDDIVSIKQTSKITSLNASCASAVVLFEVYKQKAE